MPIPLGILAVAGAGGGALTNDYFLLSSTILTGNQASITFSSINQTYKHLQIRMTGRTDRASDNDTLFIRFNNNTSGYRAHFLMGDGSTVTSADRGTGLTRIDIQGAFTGNTSVASNFGAAVIDILDYANTNKNTTVRYFGGLHNTSGTNRYISLASGLWNNTAAVTEILIDKNASNFVSGTRVSLYGIR